MKFFAFFIELSSHVLHIDILNQGEKTKINLVIIYLFIRIFSRRLNNNVVIMYVYKTLTP